MSSWATHHIDLGYGADRPLEPPCPQQQKLFDSVLESPKDSWEMASQALIEHLSANPASPAVVGQLNPSQRYMLKGILFSSVRNINEKAHAATKSYIEGLYTYGDAASARENAVQYAGFLAHMVKNKKNSQEAQAWAGARLIDFLTSQNKAQNDQTYLVGIAASLVEGTREQNPSCRQTLLAFVENADLTRGLKDKENIDPVVLSLITHAQDIPSTLARDKNKALQECLEVELAKPLPRQKAGWVWVNKPAG